MSSLPEIVDLVGLGFGPANIAIAGAVTEAWKENPVSLDPVPLFILCMTLTLSAVLPRQNNAFHRKA